MPWLAYHQTFDDHLKHPEGFRSILRHKGTGIVTFAWDETPEVPNNPDVIVCFHAEGGGFDKKLTTMDGSITLRSGNPSSMGLQSGRKVWHNFFAQGWNVWTPS